jgi:hypothetical protein
MDSDMARRALSTVDVDGYVEVSPSAVTDAETSAPVESVRNTLSGRWRRLYRSLHPC